MTSVTLFIVILALWVTTSGMLFKDSKVKKVANITFMIVMVIWFIMLVIQHA